MHGGTEGGRRETEREGGKEKSEYESVCVGERERERERERMSVREHACEIQSEGKQHS